jgi:hypothetical protein
MACARARSPPTSPPSCSFHFMFPAVKCGVNTHIFRAGSALWLCPLCTLTVVKLWTLCVIKKYPDTAYYTLQGEGSGLIWAAKPPKS